MKKNSSLQCVRAVPRLVHRKSKDNRDPCRKREFLKLIASILPALSADDIYLIREAHRVFSQAHSSLEQTEPKHPNVTHRAVFALYHLIAAVSTISNFALLTIFIKCTVIPLSHCWILINFVISLPLSHAGDVGGNVEYTPAVILSVIAV